MTEDLDFVGEAILQAKTERDLRSIAHLHRRGLLDDDAWNRIIEELPINGGRKPEESTALRQEHRERWCQTVRACMKAEGVRGGVHRKRIARQLYPDFDTFPDGTPFVWSSAIHIAEKGPGTARKDTKRKSPSDR